MNERTKRTPTIKFALLYSFPMKDLVEHIRTVHFTVLVVALILTAALQIEKRRTMERAASDAEAILLLSQRWDETSTVLSSAITAHHPPGPSSSDGTPINSDNPHPGLYSVGSSDGPRKFRLRQSWVYVNQSPRVGSMADYKISAWSTLKEFLAFWDGIHDGKQVFLPIKLVPDPKNAFCKNIQKVPESEAEDDEDADLVFEAQKSANDDVTWSLHSSVDTVVGENNRKVASCAFKPINVRPIAIDQSLALVFMQLTPQAQNWGTSDSRSEFPELIDAAKHLEDLPLANLAQTLRERANQDTDKIELFQAKLPASAIPTFGSLILILCQFYLLAHLAELRRMSRETKPSETPTGYIGLYQNPLIFVFTIVSLVIFPVIPLIIESRQNLGTSRQIAIGEAALSLLLGLCCSFVLCLIRRGLLNHRVVEFTD
jgi:hypothetical protein